MEQTPQQRDYNLTLFEVCEILNKSSRTVSRYVHKNILHPVGVKSRQGTLEYRFSRAEVDEVKRREDQIRSINFPHLIEMGQGVASFASVNYQTPAAAPQTQFAIPGVAYPVVPNQSQPGNSADPALAYRPEPSTSASNINSGNPNSGNPNKEILSEPSNINETTGASAPVSDRDNQQIITLLKETTEMLRGQLRVKDDQIKNLDEKIGQLIERNRETNILLKGLQDKMVLLEKPEKENSQTGQQEIVSRPEPENIKPTVAPAPRLTESQAPPVRVRVSYSDEIQEMGSQGMATVKNIHQRNNEDDWPNIPARNDKPPAKGIFGKIFH